MVDVTVLQSLSYVAAAISVCVAAVYHVMTLMNAEKAPRKDLVFQRLQPPLVISKEQLDRAVTVIDNSLIEIK